MDVIETHPYSMVIQWSERDQAFLVTLPEWTDRLVGPAATHGNTYEEAAKNGCEALEVLIEDALDSGEQLPEPSIFAITA